MGPGNLVSFSKLTRMCLTMGSSCMESSSDSSAESSDLIEADATDLCLETVEIDATDLCLETIDPCLDGVLMSVDVMELSILPMRE